LKKILLQKEIYKDFLAGKSSPEISRDRARDFYDIHKIWEYYSCTLPLDINEICSFIDSRIKNRKTKTNIKKEEFNKFSLLKQFTVQEISKQLKIDKSKLSIRDLDYKAIENSLYQIDNYFRKIF
jgi:hypothetical protein